MMLTSLGLSSFAFASPRSSFSYVCPCRMAPRVRSQYAQSGKPQFGYIYGLALLGSISLYFLLNLMSEQAIDAYRVLSVLGYCLLPMVGVGALSVIVTLEYVNVYTLVGTSYLCSRSQRHAGLRAFLPIHRLVYLRRIWHLRCRSSHVRSASSSRLPRWTSLWLLCVAQRVQRGWFKVVHVSVPMYPD